ncbi:Transcriptional adapter ada2 [Malassezia yamatoensis]|uniref:Transcriptional adapter ada2 n=1 Tax=Malassezia yamatoensis TaxID=253288 RepID=A0AAJ5YWF6_9BASI|nr:Transcriptional adapter ada2 [Malassezia yamatoensis]
MTVSHRKPRPSQPNQDRTGELYVLMIASEPGVRYHCDICGADITLTVRIRCAGGCNEFDLCGTCFCTGAETAQHKAWHAYRVIEQHVQPVYCPDWGADEELLLLDGCQLYGVGNWADIADHIGNRSKAEVEQHFVSVYVEGQNGLPSGTARAEKAVLQWRQEHPENQPRQGEEPLPVVGPDPNFAYDISPEEFQRERREHIERLRAEQASFVPPKPNTKPLTSAPTSHSEITGFMPGRLEFEQEFEQDAEHLVKDMEFGRVYQFGGDAMPDEFDALGEQGATQGHARMEASGRGGPVTQRTTENSTEDENEEEFMDATEHPSDSAVDDSHLAKSSKTPNQAEAAEAVGNAAADEAEHQDSDAKSNQEKEAGDEEKPKADGEKGEADNSGDRAPDWDEDPLDLRLKLAVLEMYNDALDKRSRKKHFLFSRNLMDYRRNVAAERRRPKEERDLLARVRHFATLQSATDFDEFYHHLCYEEALKRTVHQLQQYRRMGLTTFSEAARYDKEAAERTKRQLEAAEGSLTMNGPHVGRVRHRERSVSLMEEQKPDDFSFASAPGIQLLSENEQQLCSQLHILPEPFLVLKASLLTYSYAHHKALTLAHCQALCDIAPRKLSRLYDFFVQQGYVHAVLDACEWRKERSSKQRRISTSSETNVV